MTEDGERGEAGRETASLKTPDPAVSECRPTAGFPILSGQ